jgi:serine/threonine protein kinase
MSSEDPTLADSAHSASLAPIRGLPTIGPADQGTRAWTPPARLADPARWAGFRIAKDVTVEHLVRVTRSTISFRALSARHARSVFVKIARRSSRRGESQAARFFEESVLLSRLKLLGVPEFLGAGLSVRHPYLMTSWAVGVPLSQTGEIDADLASWPAGAGVAQRLTLVANLARLVSACHEHGVYHRDVKPANLIVDPVNLDVSLVDWGIAFCPSLTPGAVPRGARTPLFSSPERNDGCAGQGAEDDAYGVGLVALQLLLGYPIRQLRAAPQRLIYWRLSTGGVPSAAAEEIVSLVSTAPSRRLAALRAVAAAQPDKCIR